MRKVELKINKNFCYTERNSGRTAGCFNPVGISAPPQPRTPMKRFLYSIVLFCTAALNSSGKETTLTIFSINDVYEIVPRDGHGGLAQMMTILKGEREQADHYLTTVNGDFLSPSVISGIFQGAQMIDLMNMLEVDVVVFGNHEFDFGTNVLSQRMKESKFCWLGTNVLSLLKEKPLDKAQGSVVFEVDGIKVGMIGLCTTETNTLVHDLHEVTVTPPILTAQAAVHKLKKEGVDVIVALTHLNFEDDLILAAQVPEIDVILGGHDHEVMTWYNGRTFVHKSGHDAMFLARIDLRIEKKEVGQKTKISVFPTWKMIHNYGFSEDPEAAKKIAYYSQTVDKELSHQIAVCSTPLDSTDVRFSETTMGNLVADAMRSYFQADLAIMNGGGIRGSKLYLPGTAITKRDIQEELPFADICVLLEVTGEQILKTFEYALSKIDVKGGSFPQVSGVRVIYDPNNHPLGERICEGYVDGKPIDKTKTYRLATNDYVLRGGDGNFGLKGAKTVIGPGIGPLLTKVVCDYLKEMGVVSAALEGRMFDGSIAKEVKTGDTTGKRIHFN